jgi:hypothetical protein
MRVKSTRELKKDFTISTKLRNYYSEGLVNLAKTIKMPLNPCPAPLKLFIHILFRATYGTGLLLVVSEKGSSYVSEIW